MDKRGAIGNDFDARADEIVDNASDLPFISGNRSRGKDHLITRIERDHGVRALGHAGDRSAAFPLASGCQKDKLVAGDVWKGVLGQKIRNAIEIAAFAGNGGHPLHRAPGHHDRAAGCHRGLGDGANAGNI